MSPGPEPDPGRRRTKGKSRSECEEGWPVCGVTGESRFGGARGGAVASAGEGMGRVRVKWTSSSDARLCAAASFYEIYEHPISTIWLLKRTEYSSVVSLATIWKISTRT